MTNPAKAPASVQPRRKRRKHWLQRDWRLYLMLLIPIVWYILFLSLIHISEPTRPY